MLSKGSPLSLGVNGGSGMPASKCLTPAVACSTAPSTAAAFAWRVPSTFSKGGGRASASRLARGTWESSAGVIMGDITGESGSGVDVGDIGCTGGRGVVRPDASGVSPGDASPIAKRALSRSSRFGRRLEDACGSFSCACAPATGVALRETGAGLAER